MVVAWDSEICPEQIPRKTYFKPNLYLCLGKEEKKRRKYSRPISIDGINIQTFKFRMTWTCEKRTAVINLIRSPNNPTSKQPPRTWCLSTDYWLSAAVRAHCVCFRGCKSNNYKLDTALWLQTISISYYVRVQLHKNKHNIHFTLSNKLRWTCNGRQHFPFLAPTCILLRMTIFRSWNNQNAESNSPNLCEQKSTTSTFRSKIY